MCAECLRAALSGSPSVKKTAARGVARDCFCLSSCSILNPTSPSNAWRSRVGEGTYECKTCLRRFPCCSENGLGDGRPRSLLDSLNPGHPDRNASCTVSPDSLNVEGNLRTGGLAITMYLEWKGVLVSSSWISWHWIEQKGHNITEMAFEMCVDKMATTKPPRVNETLHQMTGWHFECGMWEIVVRINDCVSSWVIYILCDYFGLNMVVAFI